MKYKNFLILVLLAGTTVLLGCTPVAEVGKKVWGSSTDTLNNERKNAIKKTFGCSLDACFDKVLELTSIPTMPATKVLTTKEKEKYLELFQQNRSKMVIVVMGVPGAVDTTEVGIFFVALEKDKVRVELSSLSTSAKVKAADMVFAKLTEAFSEVKP